MKKILTLIMALAMVVAASAATKTSIVFNKAQFQNGEEGTVALTVPMVYKGSLSFDGWFVDSDLDGVDDPNKDCLVDDLKVKYDLFMTMCQPCLDCRPCTFLDSVDVDRDPAEFNAEGEAPITRWNLYVVRKYKEDHVNKAVAYKVDLLDVDYDHFANFFTGAVKKEAFVSYENDSDNVLMCQVLTGKKSDYKFSFYTAAYEDDGAGNFAWTQPAGNKQTAYIKSIASMSGDFIMQCADDVEKDEALYVGTAKLTRNASLTKKAIDEVFGAQYTFDKGNWEDCHQPVNASICEEYFLGADDDEDAFDAYLRATAYKSYEVKGNFAIEGKDEFDAYVDAFLAL